MKNFLLALSIIPLSLFSQEPIPIKYDKAPTPIGGKADVDYIIATQMQYPPALLKKKAKEEANEGETREDEECRNGCRVYRDSQIDGI